MRWTPVQLQAVPRDVVCASIKGSLAGGLQPCVAPTTVATTQVFTSGHLVNIPTLTTSFDSDLVRWTRG